MLGDVHSAFDAGFQAGFREGRSHAKQLIRKKIKRTKTKHARVADYQRNLVTWINGMTDRERQGGRDDE